MFVLNDSIKVLDKNMKILSAKGSMGSQNVSSSRGGSDYGSAYTIQGSLDGEFFVYVVLHFSTHNDFYVSDDLILDQDDLSRVWEEGLEFAEDMGFYFDSISESELKTTTIFQESLLEEDEILSLLDSTIENVEEKSTIFPKSEKKYTKEEIYEIIKLRSFY
ncbi:hypothetical protein JXR93_13885 [bacterium]|nr:hypothetical protein [bacterium]